MKNTVYVVMDSPGKNLLPAREYGNLHVMLTGKENNQQAIVKLEHALRDIRPDDYLLLIGNPVFIALASHIAFTLCDGRVNLLVWDRESYSYNCEKINYGSDTEPVNSGAHRR